MRYDCFVRLKQKHSLINKIMGDNWRYFQTSGVKRATKKLLNTFNFFLHNLLIVYNFVAYNFD